MLTFGSEYGSELAAMNLKGDVLKDDPDPDASHQLLQARTRFNLNQVKIINHGLVVKILVPGSTYIFIINSKILIWDSCIFSICVVVLLPLLTPYSPCKRPPPLVNAILLPLDALLPCTRHPPPLDAFLPL